MDLFSSSLETETKSKPKPLLLKDFLRDDPNSSSNDFRSFPRRSNTTVRKLLEIDLNYEDAFSGRRLIRSRSQSAASTTISAFQKASEVVINAVKHFPFSSVKSPPKQGILPRSFSQTLRRSFRWKTEKETHEIRARVRVRDVMRWKSFQEEEKKKKELRSSCSINSSSRSSNSSWTESDFTSDFLQSSCGSSEYFGENEGIEGKKHLPERSRHKRSSVGEDSVETTTCYGDAKVKQRQEKESREELKNPYEEKEQLSPVSVLDFPYEDEDTETPSSSFEDSLANMERTKQQLLQKIRRFECLAQMDPVDLEKRIAQSEEEEEEEEEVLQVDDKARDLLKLFKTSSGKSHKRNVDKLLVDFFREGLVSSQRNLTRQADARADGIEEELLRAASDWMNGYVGMEWGVEDNRETCLKEMSRDGRWRKFKEEEEEEELAMEMGIGVLGSLVEELLLDLLLD